jgi:hypothetical protein
MPPLLYYDPSGATFHPISLEQYSKLIAAMKANSKVSRLIVEHNPNLVANQDFGSCEVQGVDFAWAFDGKENLHISITAKHGLFVSHVPNATIFDKLNDEFVSGI